MRFQTLARLSLAAAVALLLSGPVVLAGDTQAADGDSTAVPSAEQDCDDGNRTRDDGVVKREDGITPPPRMEMPEEGGRHERLDRRIGSRPERPERVDRVGSDVPRPDVRPERAERPSGISGVRPNG